MSSLEKEIINWFKRNKRDLPWRKTDPWGVMVSEFMLQQTPVNRVVPKWHEWMSRWPTPVALAAASPAEVITAWGRLGYPRRALRLYESAKIIVRDHDGEVPRTEVELRALPGIGEYTAAAICAFAHEHETLVLDINIRRLFARVIDGTQFPTLAPSTKERSARAELIPRSNAHVWAVATMELGALICTSRNPKCNECPVASRCSWRANGYPESARTKKVQSWHGTDRQCRGIVVQALRENESLATRAIKKLWHDDSQIEKALQSLTADGLITKVKRSQYCLPKNP